MRGNGAFRGGSRCRSLWRLFRCLVALLFVVCAVLRYKQLAADNAIAVNEHYMNQLVSPLRLFGKPTRKAVANIAPPRLDAASPVSNRTRVEGPSTHSVEVTPLPLPSALRNAEPSSADSATSTADDLSFKEDVVSSVLHQSDPDVQLFVVWQGAMAHVDKILRDIAKKFVVIDVVEFRWLPTHGATTDRVQLFRENLWALYNGKGGWHRNGMDLKVRQCGKGPFVALVVVDPRPVYADEATAHGTDHVNSHMNAAKKLYRGWSGGGFRVHGTFNAAEADHDIAVLFHRRKEALFRDFVASAGRAQRGLVGRYLATASNESGSPESVFVTSNLTAGFAGWESCEVLDTVLRTLPALRIRTSSGGAKLDAVHCHSWPSEVTFYIPGSHLWAAVAALHGRAVASSTSSLRDDEEPSRFAVDLPSSSLASWRSHVVNVAFHVVADDGAPSSSHAASKRSRGRTQHRRKGGHGADGG